LHLDREGWTDPDDPPPQTELLKDATKTILAHNDSPDVGFDVSINPYRGCSHGCAYCYARPSHEYLGFSAGLDFETKILVKEKAADLLRTELSSRRWIPRVIGMSGNTDAYQPVERRLRVTRRCLEVLAEFRNPVQIITKNYLVTRDVDLLQELARYRAVTVVFSITSLRNDIQRTMEPRASIPARRLGAMRVLADAGIPVGVNVAPVVPGLTDHEIPEILEASAAAGASYASYIMLRLPWGVKDIFADWLSRHFPDRKDKVLNRVRSVRGGRLYDGRYEVRGRGEGPWADQVRSLFRITRDRLALTHHPRLSTADFQRTSSESGPQFDLFGEGPSN
jgi:DNA repair photolyase